jgi:hypothetical protein
MKGLDNAVITFKNFFVPREAMLSRYSSVGDDGKYVAALPGKTKKMIELVISRLLTGRLCLSEFTLSAALALLRHNFTYCSNRTLWKVIASPGEPQFGSIHCRSFTLSFLLSINQ